MSLISNPSYHYSNPVTVKYDVGFGNELYIFGQGLQGMNWDSGIKLTKVPDDKDTWVLGAERSQEVFLKNRAARHRLDGKTAYILKFVIVEKNGNKIWEKGENRDRLGTKGLTESPTF